ncbi:MAG: molybdopterin converting factor subunit 1 [Rhodospirillales bacterium]
MRLRYFAWLRQRVGVAAEEIDPPPDVRDVAGLFAHLRARSPRQAEAFGELAVVKGAVNQTHVGFDHPVAPGDEVAFFPPVTGG